MIYSSVLQIKKLYISVWNISLKFKPENLQTSKITSTWNINWNSLCDPTKCLILCQTNLAWFRVVKETRISYSIGEWSPIQHKICYITHYRESWNMDMEYVHAEYEH